MSSKFFAVFLKNRGTALAYALGLVLICSMLMAGGAGLIVGSLKGGSIHLARSQVENVAKAGFRDAVMWFRRSETQPVEIFDPTYHDSEDPSIGLVSSFPINVTQGVWGRYEVERSVVRDLSMERGRENKGVVWEIQTTGYVYEAKDPTKGFSSPPNKIIARTTMVGEITRIAIMLPPSAIISYRAMQITLGNNVIVNGGEEGSGFAAVTHESGTGKTNIHGEIYGDPPIVVIDNMDIEVPTVFGVTQEELRNMCDYVVGSVDELPYPLPDMAFVYIDGNASFSKSIPITGGGLLFVNGNVSIPAGTGSEFTGLVYVMDEFSAAAQLEITGSLVVRGSIAITGGPGQSIITYDPEVLEALNKSISQYRESKSVHIPTGG
jgi:hypothetical protein